MQKDFDGWNEQKKEINEYASAPFYREQEIHWCRLGANIGFEQDGTGKGRSRPVGILKGLNKSICIVVPLTTSLKEDPYCLPIGMVEGKPAAAILSQIRAIDTRRLYHYVGVLDPMPFAEIRKAVRNMF